MRHTTNSKQSIAQRDSAAGVRYLHRDQLGSASVATNASGVLTSWQRFDPWGKVRASANAMPTKRNFTGQYLDDTGLLFYNARYYDPGIGRFVSADWIVPGAPALTVHPFGSVAGGMWGASAGSAGGGGPGNAQDLNRYSYALNNPVRNTDPTGHLVWIPALILIARVAAPIVARAAVRYAPQAIRAVQSTMVAAAKNPMIQGGATNAAVTGIAETAKGTSPQETSMNMAASFGPGMLGGGVAGALVKNAYGQAVTNVAVSTVATHTGLGSPTSQTTSGNLPATTMGSMYTAGLDMYTVLLNGSKELSPRLAVPAGILTALAGSFVEGIVERVQHEPPATEEGRR